MSRIALGLDFGVSTTVAAVAVDEPALSLRASMASPRQFGDFQTPYELSTQLCELLLRRGVSPRLVIEPTCGTGSFVLAAANAFNGAEVLGFDINPDHLAEARRKIEAADLAHRVTVIEGNVFTADWRHQLEAAPSPLLIIGNPPWVTSADMRRFGGDNLPEKSNLKSLKGLDAITGAGNFDISEWILLSFLEGLRDRRATVAMLCKKIVARRVVEYAAKRDLALDCEGFWNIEAKRVFGASVSAGFFVFHTGTQCGESICDCMDLTERGEEATSQAFGVVDGLLLSDRRAYHRWRALRGEDSLRWRSGIKHDCTKVMELRQVRPGVYQNGYGEEELLEEEYLYPHVKSSDLHHGTLDSLERRVLVTQRRVGDATAPIEGNAARTWAYLCRHRARLDGRASSNLRPTTRVRNLWHWSLRLLSIQSRHLRALEGPPFCMPRTGRRQTSHGRRHLLPLGFSRGDARASRRDASHECSCTGVSSRIDVLRRQAPRHRQAPRAASPRSPRAMDPRA